MCQDKTFFNSKIFKKFQSFNRENYHDKSEKTLLLLKQKVKGSNLGWSEPSKGT